MTQQVHGTAAGPATRWAYRLLLLRGARQPSDKQWRRGRTLLTTDDPTGLIQLAWTRF